MPPIARRQHVRSVRCERSEKWTGGAAHVPNEEYSAVGMSGKLPAKSADLRSPAHLSAGNVGVAMDNRKTLFSVMTSSFTTSTENSSTVSHGCVRSASRVGCAREVSANAIVSPAIAVKYSSMFWGSSVLSVTCAVPCMPESLKRTRPKVPRRVCSSTT